MTVLTHLLHPRRMTWVNATTTARPDARWRLFEGGLALSAVVAGALILAAPDQDSTAATGKTRPGFATDFNLARNGEVMIAAYTGAPYTYPSDVRVKAPGKHDFTAKDVNWIGEPFDNPIYYGVRVLRWGKSTRSGWMVDFTHSKAIGAREQILDLEGTLDGQPAPQGKKIKEVFDKLEASHGHNMLTLNGLLRLPSWGLRLHPYVGLGAGISLPHSEVKFKNNDKRTYEYQYTGPVAQGLVGLELRFDRTSYFLEYKFTFARYMMPLSERNGTYLFTDLWAQFQDWWQGKEPAGGRLTTDFASHQVIGGVGVRVVPTPVPAAP